MEQEAQTSSGQEKGARSKTTQGEGMRSTFPVVELDIEMSEIPRLIAD